MINKVDQILFAEKRKLEAKIRQRKNEIEKMQIEIEQINNKLNKENERE